jgi:hypothetical protein
LIYPLSASVLMAEAFSEPAFYLAYLGRPPGRVFGIGVMIHLKEQINTQQCIRANTLRGMSKFYERDAERVKLEFISQGGENA